MGAYDITVEDGKATFTKKAYVTKAQRKALQGVEGPTGTPVQVQATEAVPSPSTPAGPTDPKPGTRGSTPPADPQT